MRKVRNACVRLSNIALHMYKDGSDLSTGLAALDLFTMLAVPQMDFEIVYYLARLCCVKFA